MDKVDLVKEAVTILAYKRAVEGCKVGCVWTDKDVLLFELAAGILENMKN